MPPKNKNTKSYRTLSKENEEQLKKWRDYKSSKRPLITDDQMEKNEQEIGSTTRGKESVPKLKEWKPRKSTTKIESKSVELRYA